MLIDHEAKRIDPHKVSTTVLAEYIISGAGEDEYEAEAGRRLKLLAKNQGDMLAALEDCPLNLLEAADSILLGKWWNRVSKIIQRVKKG